MPRYVTRGMRERDRPFFDDGSTFMEKQPETVMVQVRDRDDFTGLYNELGEPLYREREAFGFKVRG